mgnify:CR=1 FL=1
MLDNFARFWRDKNHSQEGSPQTNEALFVEKHNTTKETHSPDLEIRENKIFETNIAESDSIDDILLSLDVETTRNTTIEYMVGTAKVTTGMPYIKDVIKKAHEGILSMDRFSSDTDLSKIGKLIELIPGAFGLRNKVIDILKRSTTADIGIKLNSFYSERERVLSELDEMARDLRGGTETPK